jgi:DNA-binding NtrC family response regulator
VIPILLPPLRDRREDIPLLIEHFLEHLSVETDRQVEGVSADALAALMRHDWPGNVRELRNVLERGMVVAKDKFIQPEDLGLSGSGIRAETLDPSLTLDEVERRHITAVLHHTGGNVTQAARTLDIDRVTLYNKIRKYGLRRNDEDGFGSS